jgi:hypothetical protein
MAVCPGLVVITIETWFVRLEFFNNMLHRPLAWLAVLTVLAGGVAIFTGIRNRRKSFTPRQLARILWDFAYLCWANTSYKDLS